MTKWQRPEGWPEGLDPPVLYRITPIENTTVPLADGRYTYPRFRVRFTVRQDDTTIEMSVRIVDGLPVIKSVLVEKDDGGLSLSTLRHYRLRDHLENALSLVTISPDPDTGELVLEPPSTASRKAARTAVRRKTTPELLERVAEMYRKAGGGAEGVKAIATELVYDPRHARRLRDAAIKAGKLREDER